MRENFRTARSNCPAERGTVGESFPGDGDGDGVLEVAPLSAVPSDAWRRSVGSLSSFVRVTVCVVAVCVIAVLDREERRHPAHSSRSALP